MKRSARVFAICPTLISCCVAVTASAQTLSAPANSVGAASTSAAKPKSHGLEEIVVHAEKRSTRLQRTPIAVTVLSGATIAEHQVRQLEDIQSLVPGVKIGDAQGVVQVTIRGVGSTSFLPGYEGAAAVNLNGVYLSRGVALLSGLFDVSGIEVLRGPQGTLFGRNATAGAVDIATTIPSDQWHGYARVGGGNYGENRLEGAVGGPIINDVLDVRIAGFRETHDGYGTNVETGTGIDDRDAFGFRGTVVYKPTADIKATLLAEYYDENDHSTGLHYFGAAGLTGLPGATGLPPLFETEGGFAPANVRDIANVINPDFNLRTRAITGLLDWDPNGGPLSFKSITGYRNQEAHALYDIDGGSTQNVFDFQGEPAEQFSEELQAHYDITRLHLTGGLYYFRENDQFAPGNAIVSTYALQSFLHVTYPTPGFIDLVTQNASILTDAGAAFAQGTYSVTNKLSFTAGVRYSIERKHIFDQFSFNPFTPYTGSTNPLVPTTDVPPKTFYSLTPKFGIQYQLDPETLLYASYSKGFKSGGFDVGVANPVAYHPEKLTDYEIGLKTTVFDDRLRANLAGYYYDYSNLQVQQVVGLSLQTGNAATASIYGIEGEFTFRATPALQLSASAAWSHARYNSYVGPDPAQPLLTSVNFSGNVLDNAPDYTATAAAQYNWNLRNGSLQLRGEVEYSSRFYFAPDNLALLSQGSFVKGNLFAVYQPTAPWQVTLYIKNLANTTTKQSAITTTPLIGSPVLGTLAPPRLFGVEVQYKF